MADEILQAEPLPLNPTGRKSLGFVGVMTLVATESALFAYLLFAYFYAALNVDSAWPPSGPPELAIASVNTIILLSTSFTVWLAEHYVERDRLGATAALLGVTVGFGVVFVSLQLLEWSRKDFTPVSHTYGSIYFTITGMHLAHVCVGLLVLAFLLLWTLLGYFDSSRHNALTIGAVYWHFVDAVWLFIFASLFLSPHLGLSHGG